MLTDEELAQLALEPESDLVERKESFSGGAKAKIGEAICAFANDLPGHRRPGVVFVGLRDDGRPSGLPITDALLTEIGGLRSEGNLLPLPAIVVRRLALQGREVAAIVVPPSGDPPVRWHGNVWIRVGPRRAIASRDEERILVERRQSGDLPFDSRAAAGATVADLDLDFFGSSYLPAAVSAETLAENGRSLPEQLAALHLLARSGAPNHAALLLLGKDPRASLPGAYLQFVRLDGDDLTSGILDQKELSGRLPELLRRIDELIEINVKTRTVVEGQVVEQRRPDYPAAALQQLLRNALLHRSYELHAPVYWYWFSDRIEIHSPGGLYGRVTKENFGEAGATDYRNPTLAAGLKTTGFVQRFGMGVQLARRRCVENGNPSPEFTFSPSAVLAVVRSAS